MVYFSHRNKVKSNDNIEQMPLNHTKAIRESKNKVKILFKKS